MNKFEDFQFEMNDFFKRKETLHTSNDNSFNFQLFKLSDDKEETAAYSRVHIEDVQTLDLPILYYKFVEDVKTIDEGEENTNSQSPDIPENVKKADKDEKKKLELVKTITKPGTKKIESKNLLQLECLTSESVDLYKMLAKRNPFLFKMYQTITGKTGDETVCELPMLFFWIRKPPETKYSKITNTKGIRGLVEDLTGIDINRLSRRDVEYLMKDRGNKTILDQASSPIPFIPERTPSSPASEFFKSKNTGDMISELKTEINLQELQTMQENYQYD